MIKHENIILGFTFIICIFLFIFGSHLYSLTVNETYEPVKSFGFIISISLLFIGTLFLIIILKYSPLFQNKKTDSHRLKEYFRQSINWFYFVMILSILMINFVLIGVLFFPQDEWFWRFYNGFVAVSVAMIVSYVPWFEILKKKILNASWVPLFIIFMILVFSMIFIFIFYLYF